MSEPLTPTTHYVRDLYAYARADIMLYDEAECVPEWDRWYAAERARIEAEVREQVARAIEASYLGPDSGRQFDGRDATDTAVRDAYDEGLRRAAEIARGER